MSVENSKNIVPCYKYSNHFLWCLLVDDMDSAILYWFCLYVVFLATTYAKVDSTKGSRLHKCKDTGEAYGAAYLITKEHLLYQSTGYNLSHVNCEMGSFIMMNGRANPEKNVNGSVVQTLDVLDFSMIHLSWYERLQSRHLWRDKKVPGVDPLQAIAETSDFLEKKSQSAHNHSLPLAVPELNRTVFIMPWLGSDHGAGHSKISNRLLYLKTCFWSLYEEYPYIVAVVKTERDQLFLKFESNLPFYDIVWVPNLPKSASLPVATVQAAKAKLADGAWDFDYVFFTESDQLLMIRHHHVLYDYLKLYPRHGEQLFSFRFASIIYIICCYYFCDYCNYRRSLPLLICRCTYISIISIIHH